MFEEFLGAGIALIVLAIAIRLGVRAYQPTYMAISKASEEAGQAEHAQALKRLAQTHRARENRYFYPLIIAGLAMIAISLVERI